MVISIAINDSSFLVQENSKEGSVLLHSYHYIVRMLCIVSCGQLLMCKLEYFD